MTSRPSPRPRPLGRVRSLRPLLRLLLSAAGSGALALAAIGACGGAQEPTCTIEEEPIDAGTCSNFFQRKITSDLSLCGDDLTRDQCAQLCGREGMCWINKDRSIVNCPSGLACTIDGRRPEGLEALSPSGDLGAHFAQMAYYEAAASVAFAQLARDLRAAHAPRALVRALVRASREEVRHAEIAGALAARFGATPLACDLALVPARPLFVVALENAREGCGRELLGAAVGLHVAEHAHDADVRAAFSEIARDETGHAALSLRMQRWLRSRLSTAERAVVDEAMHAALETGTTRDLPAALGAPSDAEVAVLGRLVDRAAFAWLDAA